VLADHEVDAHIHFPAVDLGCVLQETLGYLEIVLLGAFEVIFRKYEGEAQLALEILLTNEDGSVADLFESNGVLAGVFNEERLGHDLLGAMTAVCFFKDVPEVVLADDLVASDEAKDVFGKGDVYVLQFLLYIIVATGHVEIVFLVVSGEAVLS
jgi:hypothetical protein